MFSSSRSSKRNSKTLSTLPLVILGVSLSFASYAKEDSDFIKTIKSESDKSHKLNPLSAYGWYVKGDVKGSSLNDACQSGYTGCEDDSFGLGIGVGYKFQEHFGLEFGYSYLGDYVREQGNQSNTVELNRFDSLLVGEYPLSQRISVFGQVGAALWKSTFENSSSSGATGISPMIGTGMYYRLSSNTRLHFSYQWSPDIADSSTDSQTVGLGITYMFEKDKSIGVSRLFEQKTDIVTRTDIVKLPSIRTNVYFAFNKSALDQRAKKDLAPILDRLTRNPDSSVRLLGFADIKGSIKANNMISERRVKAVSDYLKSKGVQQDQIAGESFGKIDPTHSNATAEGRALNRRVTLVMNEEMVQSSGQ